MPNETSTTRITIVGLISLALAMGIGRFAFTPLLPMMQEDGLVDIAGGGWLAAVHFLGYLLGAVLAAKLPASPRAVLRFSLFAIAASTIGMGLTDDFAVWLAWRWIAGVCSAWTLVLISSYLVKRLADGERADLQGWVFSGVGAGILAAGLFCLAFMTSGIDSASSWQIMGAVTLLAVCAVSIKIGREVPNVRPTAGGHDTRRGPLEWRAVIAYGVMGLGYIIPATYLPVMARETVQSPIIFGWSWPVFGAAALVSTLIAAGLRKRHSDRQIWVASQFVMATGLLLPVIHAHIWAIIAAGLCVGGTFMIITMAGMKEAHRIAPPGDVMRHIAVMTASFATGQIIGPVFASSLYGITQSFSVSLVVTSLALAVTATGLMGGSARRGASIARRT
jgi:MFS family permease